jgi:hypothetical protein
MRAPDGRPYVRDGIGEQLRGGRKTVDVLSRRLDRQPKIPDPVASGGIVGMAEVVSAGGVQMLAGQALLRNSITYQTPDDAFAGSPGASSQAISSWCTIDASEPWKIALIPGWYNLAVTLQVNWSVKAEAPTSLSLYMQGGWDVAHNDWSIFALADTSDTLTPQWGIAQVASHGPTFINDGDAVWLECRPYGGNPTGDSNAGAVVWNITKLG